MTALCPVQGAEFSISGAYAALYQVAEAGQDEGVRTALSSGVWSLL